MSLLLAAVLAAMPARALWFGPKFKSVWRDRVIKTDGEQSDWNGIEQGEDQELSFAFANDALDLFVVLVPHSRLYRNELAGIYEQDFTIWFDAKAGMNKKLGLRFKAPPGGNPDADREFQLVHEGAQDPPACESADLRFGPINARGVVEARVPLACFGAEAGKVFTVGFEAEVPKQPPPKKKGELFDRLYTWVRVAPAARP